MTDNHLLLYRLAELMLQHEQQVLPVDLLFDDEQIGDFVKSIQIDSPYQQLLLEGVLTESVRDEKLYVSFTVEGYFHYVLGEVIYNHTEGKHAIELKKIVEENHLKGAKEGVEQCLIRDVQKDVLTRLMWLIDEGNSYLDLCSIPLASAFLNYGLKNYKHDEIESIFYESFDDILLSLLVNMSDNFISVLEKSINYLIRVQKNKFVSIIYKKLSDEVNPNSFIKLKFSLASIQYIEKDKKKLKIDRISENAFEGISQKEMAIINESIGRQYFLISDYNKSSEFFHKALSLNLNLNGAKDSSVLKSYNALGEVSFEMGEYSAALNYFEIAHSISQYIYGTDHHETGEKLNNIAAVLKQKGEYDLTLEYLKKVLVTDLKYYGKYHSSTAVTYNNLGDVYNFKEDYNNALVNLENALNIYLKIYQENHTLVARTYNNIADVWHCKGDFNLALDYFNKSLKIKLMIFEELHPSIATTYNNIGDLWISIGNFDKALYFLNKALEIRLKILDSNHAHIGISYNNIGNVFLKLHQFSDAKNNFQKSYEIFKIAFGENSKHTKLLSNKLNELNDL